MQSFFAKIIAASAAVTLCVAATIASAAEPAATPFANVFSLNGDWQFSTDATKPVPQWDAMPVPGNWDTVNEYAHYRGRAYYQRTFDVPPGWQKRHVRLKFDAVAGDAEVWLNGQSLGTHHGGFTPFEFDITALLKQVGQNELRVSSDNSTAIGAFWPWGGISRNVSLIASDDVRIVWQHIIAEPNLSTGSARITGTIRLANDGDSPRPVNLDTSIDEASVHLQQRAMVAAHGSIDVEIDAELPATSVRLWDFDHPNLYHLTTRLDGDSSSDLNQIRFGIRKISVTPDGLWLNGQKVRLNGFNRVSDHRAYGNTEPLTLIKQDVDLMKSCGTNLMRIMHTPQSPELLDYLDERGMLIFEEIPVWGNKDPNIKANSPVAEAWMREMVERDYNHPCIIGWSVGNEMIGHGPYVRSIIPYIRQNLDGHRLLTYVSNSAVWEKTLANEPEDAADLILFNCYGPLANPAKTLHQRWPDKPIFFSECGDVQFGDRLSARIPKLDKNWKDLSEQPYVIGGSLWTFNDYRSSFKGSSPAELRSWGVVDQWRQAKAAASQISKINAPVSSLIVTGNTIELTPRKMTDLPCFALDGYYLEWEWQDAGRIIRGSAVPLPVIHPGDPAIVQDAGSPPSANAELTARLITPNDYVVASSDLWKPAATQQAGQPTTRGNGPIDIRCIYPLEKAFMIAYDTQKQDASVTVEWGTTPGHYTDHLTAAQPGALMVRHLQNGTTYYVRIAANTADGRGPWSAPASVTPGEDPTPPAFIDVVRGKGDLAIVRFRPSNKATGYRLHYDGGDVSIPTSAAGVAILHGISERNDYTFTISAVNENRISAPSASIESPGLTR